MRIRNCERCGLCADRKTIVFGRGNQRAKLFFVGECPDEVEDGTGLAFSGQAGKLLDQIVHSIGLNVHAAYLTNVVKCRPPGNRKPKADEVQTCLFILKKQIEIVEPKLIVALGNTATQALLPEAPNIARMRGKLTSYNGIPLMPTYHPGYLLKRFSAANDVWNDMRQIRQFIVRNNLNDPKGMCPRCS